MPMRLSSNDSNFESQFVALLGQKREVSSDIDDAVRAIIADVRTRGDAALAELTLKYDRLDPQRAGLAITAAEIESAFAACSKETLDALYFACDRIADHHKRQLPSDDRYRDTAGVELGHRWTRRLAGALRARRLGVLSSLVLMNAVPAKVAGVPRIVMVVPSPAGELNPLVLAAANIAGVTEIYRICGAQAIAALAYGTETIRPVVKIVGPGNADVAAAKRQVFGVVGIAFIAGPSEALVIADRHDDPEFIAADLLAQAEHDTAAQSILMTDDANFATAVEQAVGRQLQILPRGNIAGQVGTDLAPRSF